MSALVTGLVAGLIIAGVIIFGIGAAYLNLTKRRNNPVLPDVLQKEDQLEDTNPSDIVAHSPDPVAHERRADELADAVRKRIRDRAGQAVSGESRAGTADHSRG